MLAKEARSLGVRKILVTHPDLALSGIGVEDQRALAAEGALVAENPARLLGLE